MIKSEDISFRFKVSSISSLKATNVLVAEYNNKEQGIISFECRGNKYELYMWYDEGRFPPTCDTCLMSGCSKLIIVGVDDI